MEPDTTRETRSTPAAEAGSLIHRSGRPGLGRWLKPTVTIALYALVFYWIDARKILAILKNAHIGQVGICVGLYMIGQAISALKWRILLTPVGLPTPYPRLLGFYFTGMFFNLFLPTIVGGTP